MTTALLTVPERTCSRAQSRVIRQHVVQDGGCCYCTHRCGLFDTPGRRALCGLEPPRAFPACVAMPNPRGGFTFDEEAFREARQKPTGD